MAVQDVWLQLLIISVSFFMQNLLPIFYRTIQTVCENWNSNHCRHWNFAIDANRKSIARTHFFLQDFFTCNPALVSEPGPFKIAAGFVVGGMQMIEFNFYPLVEDGKQMDAAEKREWTNRLLVRSLPIFLSQLQLASTGEKLKKTWQIPTAHFKLDFLNFLRWSEFPFIATVNPPKDMPPIVDIVRLNRLVMAITLIVESCYYLSENSINCDVMHQLEIKLSDLDDASRKDLFFDCKPPWVA